jgi:hypothetical protein
MPLTGSTFGGMPAEESVTITYRGGANDASILAGFLRAEGVNVAWEAPYEQRSGTGQIAPVVVDYIVQPGSKALVGAAAVALARTAIAKFKARSPQSEVDIHDTEGTDDGSAPLPE